MADDLPKGPDLSPTSSTGAAGAQDSQMYSDVRQLAQTLAPSTDLSAKLIKGTVVSIQVGTGQQVTCTITLGGDTTTTIPSVRKLDFYSPVVGDVVQVIMQGTEILILGRVDQPTTASAQNGWTTPTLGANFSHVSIDAVQYRVVTDNGDRKIQLRGSCTVSGTPTALWTMPAGLRPAAYRSLVISRDVAGGSNTAVLGVNTNGTMFLDGTTTGIRSVATATGADGGFSGNVSTTQHGQVGSSQVSVSHYHNNLGPGDGGINYAGGNPHFHNTNSATHTHSISVGDHTHTIAASSVLFPDGLSFHGVEYFL